MGYAQASGLPAHTGPYATIIPLLAYALAGPSRILVLGPDSALAPVLLAAIVPLAGGDGQRAVALAGLLGIMVGALLLLGGMLRNARTPSWRARLSRAFSWWVCWRASASPSRRHSRRSCYGPGVRTGRKCA
jgi:hypothetical protein